MNASLCRTLWISRVTFLEAVRQRFFAFLLVLGAAMVLSSVSFRVFDFGHGELKFIADFGDGAIKFRLVTTTDRHLRALIREGLCTAKAKTCRARGNCGRSA